MEQVATATWSPRSDRKANAVWIAMVWAGVVAGFGLDLSHFRSETPSPPVVLNVHGVIYLVWLALVTLQIFWVETGHLKRHKQFGWLTIGLSALMVPLGLAAAMVDQVRQSTHPDYAPQFLGLEFEEVIAFSVFVTTGVLFRRNLAAHKRLMILAAVSISDAGFARVFFVGFNAPISGPFSFWVECFSGICLILLAMMAWDLWRWRRIHPAVLAGAALLWSGELIATALYFTPGWHTAMVRLVSAWGYAG